MKSDYEKFQLKLGRRRIIIFGASAIFATFSLLFAFISKASLNREKVMASQTQQEAAALKEKLARCEETAWRAKESAIRDREAAEQMRLEMARNKK